MRAAVLETRADQRGIPRSAVCAAVDVLRPLLEEEVSSATRWRWVYRLGVRSVLALLGEYQERNCTRHMGGGFMGP